MSPDLFPRGRFTWHELHTPDTAGAVAFYTEVVGWRTRAWEHDPSYLLWTKDGAPMAGLLTLTDELKQLGVRPSWLPYLAVPDAEATAGRAFGLGGTVLRAPEFVPDVGRWALLQDPQGALIAVLEPEAEPTGHDGEPGIGEFSWHELATTDWRAAWAFYRELFGWDQMDQMDMGPAGIYQMFGRAGRMLGGMYTRPPETPDPPHWLCYAKVPNADRAADTVRRLGGSLRGEPMDVPGGDRIAQCVDPQGVAFAVHSAAAAVAAPPKEPAARPAAAKTGATKKPAPKKPAAKKPAAKKPVTQRPVKKAAVRRRPVKKKATKRR